jgi:hypothetical protein
MNHDEWTKRFKAVLQDAESDLAVTLDLTLRLAEDARLVARDAVSLWHERQALGHAIGLYKKMGRNAEAGALLERLARDHQVEIAGHGHSAAQLLAEAALLHFQMDEGDAGARLAQEALQLFGQFPEANIFLMDLIREWRRHLEKKHESLVPPK